jgi:RHS repeat-associated protein
VPQVGVKNKYLYNGKELNEDIGLDWLDYGARWYDPAIARWNAVDLLADEMPEWSPYNFVFNNPLRYIDLLGLSPDDIIFNSIDEYGNKTELGRIVSTIFDEEFNIPLNLLSVPENYEPVNVEMDERISDALDNKGIQAFSLDISGEVAYKAGVQVEVSVIGIVGGDDKGDWGIALQANGLVGLEASVTGSASAYFPISNGDLSLDKLRGFEYGPQVSVLGPSGSYFEGFEFTSSYPFVERVYGGFSLGGSIGIPELAGGSGSGYIGFTEFLVRSDN